MCSAVLPSIARLGFWRVKHNCEVSCAVCKETSEEYRNTFERHLAMEYNSFCVFTVMIMSYCVRTPLRHILCSALPPAVTMDSGTRKEEFVGHGMDRQWTQTDLAMDAVRTPRNSLQSAIEGVKTRGSTPRCSRSLHSRYEKLEGARRFYRSIFRMEV